MWLEDTCNVNLRSKRFGYLPEWVVSIFCVCQCVGNMIEDVVELRGFIDVILTVRPRDLWLRRVGSGGNH